jgi:hypothetical protein
MTQRKVTASRIRVSELGDAVYRQPKKEDDAEGRPEVDLVYTVSGKQDHFVDGYPIIEDLDENGLFSAAKERSIAYAMKVEAHGKFRYYVKFGGLGGGMFDPHSMYGDGYASKRRRGLDEYKWKEVNSKAFNFYINYLKNKNKANYQNATREAI